MEQLTLEQAAEKYGELNGYTGIIEPLSSAFVAGAEWQKEQYKQLHNAAERALDYLSIKYPKEADILHELKTSLEPFK